MYPRRLLIAAALAGFLAGLVAGVPARLVLGLVPGLPVDTARVQGTLWQASVPVDAGGRPLALQWELAGTRLLLGQLAVDWQLGGSGLALSGRLAGGAGGYSLAIDDGRLEPAAVSGLLGQWGLKVDQPLVLAGFHVAVDGGGQVTDAGGRAAWGPGQVTVRRQMPVAMPALRARAYARDGSLVLEADSEREPEAVLARLELAPAARELRVVALQRLLDLAALPGAGKRPPDTPFLEMRQGF